MSLLSVQGGSTAAMAAASYGKESCLKLLIAAGVNLEQKDNVRQ